MIDPLFRARTLPIRIAAEGEPVYRVGSGAAYRNIRARDVGNGLFVIDRDVRDVRIEDVAVTGGYRVLENRARASGSGADCVGLRLAGARATGLVRSFGRLRYDSHDGILSDIQASGTLATGAHDLPVGLAFDDTAHDFRIERCTMRGFQWQRAPKKYWNGDGFSTERGNRNFVFRRCAAWDNSDGGFDLKSSETLLDDCVSGRNARNYRLWTDIRATRLTSVDPIKIGGIGDTVHVAIMGAKRAAAAPLVIRIEHLAVRSERRWPIFDVHDGPVEIHVESHDLQVPPGTELVRTRGAGSVPGGVRFAGRPPRL